MSAGAFWMRMLVAVWQSVQPILYLLLDFDQVSMASSAHREFRQITPLVCVPQIRHARRDLDVVP